MRVASQTLLPLAVLACSASFLAAQSVPTDNDQWRGHCVTLIQGGAVPSPDGSGIPAPRFEELARERSTQGQHFVACSLFMAAAGDQVTGGNAQKSHDDMMLAKIEQKMGLGQKLSFLEKLTRSSDILANSGTTSPVTQQEVYAMSMLVQPGGAMPAPGAYPPAQYAPSGYGQGAPAQYPAAGQYAAPAGQYPAQSAQYPQQPAQYPQQQYSQPQAQYGAPAGQYPTGQSQPAPPSYPVAQNQYPAQYPNPDTSSQGQYNPPPQAGYGAQANPAPQPTGTQSTYTPLPNGQVADTGSGRMQWVLQHPSSYGTPQTCTVDWTGSGPLSQTCADALFNQAEAARNAGNCNSALTDYDNAKQAAQNAGQIVMMNLREVSGRSACGPKPKPEPGAHYGKPGAMPVGRYTCYTAPAVIANGGAYGRTAVALGQFEGYMWIFDARRYAGADIHNTGTYTMQGNSIIAQTGPYKGKDNKLTWAAQGEYGRPTIYLAYLDDNGNPIGGLGCTYDGPPAQ